MRGKRAALWLGGAAAVIAVAVFLAAPVLAGRNLVKAAKAGDAAAIERLTDFPALRASLKDELNAELVSRMRRDPRVAEKGLGGLVMMIGPSLVEGAVDSFVTPEGVAQLATTARAPDPTRPERPRADRSGGADLHQAWGYRDLNHFAVTLTDRNQPDDRLALILERRGLFAWKLAAVDLTLEP